MNVSTLMKTRARVLGGRAAAVDHGLGRASSNPPPRIATITFSRTVVVLCASSGGRGPGHLEARGALYKAAAEEKQ